MTYSDTIAAVSTPFGKGGVAVIRISGPQAFDVVQRIFRPHGGRALSDYPDRTAVWGEMVAPASSGVGGDLAGDFAMEAGEVLDDGLCTLFRGPRSYTGEDTAELSCHGGVLVTRDVLTACLLAGARQALPGEFTRRAYLNGRLDLERAEALGLLLDAGNRQQVRLSRAGMNGLLTERAEEIYRDLCGVLANMEAGMDFPEEDLTELTPAEVRAALQQVLEKLRQVSATYRTGRAIAEGVPTVICGTPNVGKSAFYNRLVGRDAAIVTDVAGTTRDVLTETVSVGRVTLRLCDTAGLHETDDPVESIGVARARRAMEDAELIFVLFDPSRPYGAEDIALAGRLAGEEFRGKTILWITTKADLIPAAGEGSRPFLPDGAPTDVAPLSLSSRTGDGFERLTAAVEEAFIDAELHLGADAVVFSARQAAALTSCAEAIGTALADLTAGLTYDVCADGVREAMASLGMLCGREAREDVLTEIFSRFCVGK